jgi:tetratricopeptide (TPR) repeat protein
MAATVIPFSRCPWCEADEDRDFEAWEEYVLLYERGDFPGLVRLCEATLRRWPQDVNAQYDLADAYVHNGQAQRAIAFLTPLHRAEPEQIAYQYGILEALIALGRTEKDFDWATPPRIYRVGPDVLAACFAYLCGKRRPRYVFDLKHQALADGYCLFSEDDLVAALRADARFVVECEVGLPRVSLAPGGGRRGRRPGGALARKGCSVAAGEMR